VVLIVEAVKVVTEIWSPTCNCACRLSSTVSEGVDSTFTLVIWLSAFSVTIALAPRSA